MEQEIEERVRWRSKNKYVCKRNKGEHEFLKPTIEYEPSVRYIYLTKMGILDSATPQNNKLIRTTISVVLETRCKHCGHKVTAFLKDKIK